MLQQGLWSSSYKFLLSLWSSIRLSSTWCFSYPVATKGFITTAPSCLMPTVPSTTLAHCYPSALLFPRPPSTKKLLPSPWIQWKPWRLHPSSHSLLSTLRIPSRTQHSAAATHWVRHWAFLATSPASRTKETPPSPSLLTTSLRWDNNLSLISICQKRRAPTT